MSYNTEEKPASDATSGRVRRLVSSFLSIFKRKQWVKISEVKTGEILGESDFDQSYGNDPYANARQPIIELWDITERDEISGSTRVRKTRRCTKHFY